jgi:hypothetical protein
MERAPTQFVAYPDVVATLREVKQTKSVGAVKRAYDKWASENESALVALARTHRTGVPGLQCGLRGVIEKLHLAEIAEKAPREVVQPARQPVAVVCDDGCGKRPQKRPRPRAAQLRLDCGKPHRRHRMPDTVHKSMENAWAVGRVQQQEHSVCVSRVLKSMFRGDAFVGGCLGETWVAGSVLDVAPELRPEGAADAGSELQDLFEELQSNANVFEDRKSLPWIRYHNAGRYSLVCCPTDNSRLPLIARKDVVVRFPRPSLTHLAPAEEVATELANLLEAARGNFGPGIVAAVAQIYLPGSATLMVCMDRADSTLYESTNHADNDHSAASWKPHLLHVAGLLRDTVFAFSSRCVLFLDCSPGNFLLRGTLGACTDVLVSDLDPQLYRRTQESAETCLLLNLLMVGAHIKKHATGEFAAAWRSAPTGTRTLFDFVAALPRTGLALVAWSASFTRWRPRTCLTDATLGDDMLGVLFHYFVSSAALATTENTRHLADGRSKHILATRALPTMHFFARAFEQRRRLADVLLDFWDAPLEVLARRRDTAYALELVKRIEAADRPEEGECT